MGSARVRTDSVAEIAQYPLKIERGLLDRFLEASRAQDRSGAQQLRRMIAEFVREHEQDQVA